MTVSGLVIPPVQNSVQSLSIWLRRVPVIIIHHREHRDHRGKIGQRRSEFSPKGPLHEGSEKHVRSFTYIGDIVDATIRALDRIDKAKGEIINIGSRELRTTGDGIAIIERIIGEKAPLVKSPPRYGDQKETEAIIDKAQLLLDFTPKVSLEDGLAEQYKWHVERLFPHLNADEA